MISEKDVVELASELVRIDSSNSWLVPGAPGESAAAGWIQRWLEPLGVETALEEAEPGHPNLIVRLKGRGGGRTLCLYAHLDTVGASEWPERARVPEVRGDRLIGLGAADDKGHAAAALLALREIARAKDRPRGDLMLSLVADEEGTSLGSFDFVKRHKPDAMLVLEALGLGHYTVCHQGFGSIDLVVGGRAAHGSRPDIGVDAISHMAEVIVRLNRIDREKYAPNPHPLNMKTVFHAGTIRGGADYASYPAQCVLGIEIGTQPGEGIEDRVREIEAVFAEVKALYPAFKGRIDIRLARKPFTASGHEELMRILDGEERRVIGRPIVAVGENSWGDPAIFQEAGIPTLMLGAAGDNLHAPDEWVSIPELTQLAEIVAGTARVFCA